MKKLVNAAQFDEKLEYLRAAESNEELLRRAHEITEKDQTFPMFIRMACIESERIVGVEPGIPDNVKLDMSLPKGFGDTTIRQEIRRIRNFGPSGSYINLTDFKRKQLWWALVDGLNPHEVLAITAIKDWTLFPENPFLWTLMEMMGAEVDLQRPAVKPFVGDNLVIEKDPEKAAEIFRETHGVIPGVIDVFTTGTGRSNLEDYTVVVDPVIDHPPELNTLDAERELANILASENIRPVTDIPVGAEVVIPMTFRQEVEAEFIEEPSVMGAGTYNPEMIAKIKRTLPLIMDLSPKADDVKLSEEVSKSMEDSMTEGTLKELSFEIEKMEFPPSPEDVEATTKEIIKEVEESVTFVAPKKPGRKKKEKPLDTDSTVE